MQAVTAIGSTIVVGALALSTGPDALVVAAEPATTIQLVLPIDVVELVKAIFTGVAALGSVFAAVYAVVSAARSKRAEVLATKADTKIDTVSKQIDGLLAARDLAKVKEGEAAATVAAGVSADQLQKGVALGIAQERESVAAANPSAQAPALGPSIGGKSPIPVTDEAAQRVAAATEKLADAAVKTAEKNS